MVPTSLRRAPLLARMSGIRNEPPISINSPREMSTSRPSAWVERASTSAPAALFTTNASSAPVRRRSLSRPCVERCPRVPVERSYSRLVYPAAAAIAASIAARASGARPRFVCRTTPVALSTGRSPVRLVSSTRAEISAAQSSGGPARRVRADSSDARTAETTSARGEVLSSSATRGSRRRPSTEGR